MLEKQIVLTASLALTQDERFFPLGQDSVLLASFAAPRLRGKALDLGAGQGFLGVLARLRRLDAAVDALELNEEAAAVAGRNRAAVGLQSPVICADLRQLPVELHGKYDSVLCNPPYFEEARGRVSQAHAAARCDAGASISDVCRAAFLTLKTGGRFFVCFPAGRADALFAALRENRLAPKRLRFVHPRPEKDAQLVLLEAVKQGGEGLTVLPPLVLQDAEGAFSEAYRRIYAEGGQN